MNRKVCPFCQQSSYSAATYGNWICPHCNEDLTLLKFSPLIYNRDIQIEHKEKRIVIKKARQEPSQACP